MIDRPRSIALVKLSALGDVVHALPVAAALRARFPDTRLTWVVEQRHAAILRGHPALDEVVTVDTRRWRRARTPRELVHAVREVTALARELGRAGFDVAIDLQGLLKSGVVTWLTRAPERIGFVAVRCREGSAAFTNRRVALPASARHVVDQYLALLEPLGVGQPERVAFRLPWDDAAEATIEEFFARHRLKPRDRVVILNPGAGRAEKQWPVARFAELARRLTVELAARVVVLWGPGEVEHARRIAAAGGVAAPPTNLDGLIAVLRRASALVAGDTGPLHVGAALGVSCVGLFGPTSAIRNGPYGSCHRAIQSPDGTLSAISVAQVAHAVSAVLP